jgi:signal transduction histidine kinase
VALVRTTAELALRSERTSAEYRQALAEVLDYSRSMSRLVDDLLILARADAGIEAREDAPVDLRAIVAEACEDTRALAGQRSALVHVDLPAEALVVSGEAASLRRLILIVLDNAVRYSRSQSEIRVRVTAAPRAGDGPATALVEVSDSGIGIDPNEVPRLFERFYRGARARQQAPDGSGLGLAIAQGIVERHQGSLTLASAGEGNGGQGCRVQVVLPLVCVAPLQPEGDEQTSRPKRLRSDVPSRPVEAQAATVAGSPYVVTTRAVRPNG